jgi:hypothetical protein
MKLRSAAACRLVAGFAGLFAAPSDATSIAVDVNVAPPPPRMVAPPPPRHGYVWVDGYWRWNGHRHVWVNGYWVRERRGYHWVPARWVQRGPYWHFVPGYWAR